MSNISPFPPICECPTDPCLTIEVFFFPEKMEFIIINIIIFFGGGVVMQADISPTS